LPVSLGFASSLLFLKKDPKAQEERIKKEQDIFIEGEKISKGLGELEIRGTSIFRRH